MLGAPAYLPRFSRSSVERSHNAYAAAVVVNALRRCVYSGSLAKPSYPTVYCSFTWTISTSSRYIPIQRFVVQRKTGLSMSFLRFVMTLRWMFLLQSPTPFFYVIDMIHACLVPTAYFRFRCVEKHLSCASFIPGFREFVRNSGRS